MKKALAVLALAAALAASPSLCMAAGLYSWSNYQSNAYKYFKKADLGSLQNLLKSYDQIISKQGGSRGTVPPGIYADYGWLLIKSGSRDEGKAMLMKEMELYPESSTLIMRILKRFEENEN